MDSLTPEFVGRYYDQTSQLFELMSSANIHYGYWPEDKQELSLVAAQELLTEMMIQRMRLPATAHLLDVGCGLGHPAMRISRETGCRVTGVTVSQVQVDQGNQRAAAAGLGERVRFQYADAMSLPFEDGAFQAAWALESLLHMPARAQVLREMRRVVVPGGRIGISDMIYRTPLTSDEASFIRGAFLMQSAISLPDYRTLLAESGLEVEEVLDISTNTLPTLPHLMKSFEHHNETLRAAMGEAAMSQLREAWVQAAELYRRSLGYVLIIARRG
ncbi:methyltransferase domain-containing protein [Archangium primigenium]|uniref:methyltransferase domain-containing protein n=1 Tax=[Archangium] primigenium TaxID=2792470 RepID=UPI00195EEB1D|nr:methyltransferase domain-containing protein [Archangium primigenium]MBM7114717.1 methyltransferase domain-containing protein [Archangium primigenium]